jgi:hypothetical protein
MERLLAQVLNEKFGQFLEGLSADNLKVGIWEGSVKMKNVKFKQVFAFVFVLYLR